MVRRRAILARGLRKSATNAESMLWRALREMNLPSRPRRQHPVGPFIVDFAIPGTKLAIELDGGQHAKAVAEDRRRAEELGKRGYRVVRFWNNEVLSNLEGVLETIAANLESPPPHPDPLLPRGRRGRN